MIPNVVREIPGGDQWQTQIDYSRADNWLVVEDAGKEVDVIYFYPTSVTKLSPDEPDVCAISINPLNWKRDDTYAPASENRGSLNSEGVLVEGYADAQVEPVRGVVVCTTADPAVYALQHPADALFGTESYHAYDYGFYYANLRENAAVRIAAFAQNNTK